MWYQSDGTRNNIWANRYTAATHTWGTAVEIETGTGDASDPQIAFDASGNALTVWQQRDGASYSIWANRYDVSSGWGTAALIEIGTGDANAPQIAIDASGNALAVWQQWDGTRYSIWASRYTTGSGWGTAALIETDNAGDAAGPQIAIATSGNALAVWQQWDGALYSIWSNLYIGGSGWGAAAPIETGYAGDALGPQIAFDSNGNALAVWHQSDGTRTNIWANRYTVATDTWGTATLIETDNVGLANSPQIAIDASGNALAVWEQSDGTRNNIWANRFQ